MNHFLNYNTGEKYALSYLNFALFNLTRFGNKLVLCLLITFSWVGLVQQPLLGQSYDEVREAYETADYQTALSKAESAIRKGTKDPDMLLVTAGIHRALAAENAYQKKHARKAARYYDQLRSEYDDNTSTYLKATMGREQLWQEVMAQADSLEQEKNYQQVLVLLKEATSIAPEKKQNYLLTGKLAFGMKQYDLAEQNFNYLVDSLDYEGKQIQTVLNTLLAVSLLEDSVSDAVGVLQDARKLDDDSINADHMRAELLISKGKMDYAEDWMDSVGMQDREKAVLYQEMAERSQGEEDAKRTISYFEKALEADPHLNEARYMLAVTHQRLAYQIINQKKKTSKKQRGKAVSHLQVAHQHLQRLEQESPGYPLLKYTLRNVEESLERLS